MPKIDRDGAEGGQRAGMPVKRPAFVNRGGAGLLRKLTDAERGALVPAVDVERPVPAKVMARHRIAPALQHLAVPADSLTLDPENARLHPERNLQAIKDSLTAYGQVKPLVVRASTRVVVAGNGTLEAARALGWTEVAANLMDMSELEAAGFGLADNRTAELATWNVAALARINKLLAAAGHEAVGWTGDELDVLLANDWIPPEQGQVPEGTPWQDLWVGMPEFEQQDLTSFRHLVVHFRCEEDFLDFLAKVGQTPSDVRQKSIWHPRADVETFADKRWVADDGATGEVTDGSK